MTYQAPQKCKFNIESLLNQRVRLILCQPSQFPKVFSMNKIFIIIFSILILVGCKQEESGKYNRQFINPSIENAQIPFREYLVDASKGDTLVYKTGSIILFPPNSFIDKDGNIVKGNVQVKYREFTSPIDFYLAGIPMAYDSAGTRYNLESSGMCEIVAFKDGEPVFVNPESQPEVNLAITNKEINNHYYLDTVEQKWIYKDECAVIDLVKPGSGSKVVASAGSDLVEPVKPGKANNSTPIINIVIDPASFKELMVYDNLKFQVDPSDKNFNPEDAEEEWSNVELLKGTTSGLYTIRFTNDKKTVSYAARPVLVGEDYDKALRVFEKQRMEYEHKTRQRLAKEQKDKEQYLKDSVLIANDNERIEKLNKLVEARNRKFEQDKSAIDEASASINSFSVFPVRAFGVHNVDEPVWKELSPPIAATFKDKDGNTLALRNIAVICRNFNSLYTFADNNIGVVKNADNMIIGTVNGLFAYLTYDDFKKTDTQAPSVEFTMNVVSGKDNNLDYIIGRTSK